MLGATELERILEENLRYSMGTNAPVEQLDFGFPKVPRHDLWVEKCDVVILPAQIPKKLVFGLVENDLYPDQLDLFDKSLPTSGGVNKVYGYKVSNGANTANGIYKVSVGKWSTKDKIRNWFIAHKKRIEGAVDLSFSILLTAGCILSGIEHNGTAFFFSFLANFYFIQTCHYRQELNNGL